MVNYEKVFIPTLRRLSDLINKQYGCRFEYLNTLSLQKGSLEVVLRLLEQGKPALTESAIFFPVMPDGKLLGAAQIHGHQKLGPGEIANLNQTIRMVLESTLMNVDRLDTLHQLEEQLDRMSNHQASHSNLVDIKDLKDRRKTEVDPKDYSRWKLKQRLSFPFLIEAQTEEDAFRMALEVHDVSGRNFFTPIEDLDVSTFASVDSIKSLGACTIFAQDFEHLPLDTQRMFLDYYQSPRDARSPQVVVGSVRSLSDLRTDAAINQDFLGCLSVGYLYLNQPFSFYKSGDILEFFFDSLTGRTSATSDLEQ
jgi:hypothetical protein